MSGSDLGGMDRGDETLVRFVCRFCEEVEWDVWVTYRGGNQFVASTPGGTCCPECFRPGQPIDD